MESKENQALVYLMSRIEIYDARRRSGLVSDDDEAGDLLRWVHEQLEHLVESVNREAGRALSCMTMGLELDESRPDHTQIGTLHIACTEYSEFTIRWSSPAFDDRSPQDFESLAVQRWGPLWTADRREDVEALVNKAVAALDPPLPS